MSCPIGSAQLAANQWDQQATENKALGSKAVKQYVRGLSGVRSEESRIIRTPFFGYVFGMCAEPEAVRGDVDLAGPCQDPSVTIRFDLLKEFRVSEILENALSDGYNFPKGRKV